MAKSRLRTELCDLLGIEYPILQAGMGRSDGTPTPPPLVAAVSEAGGLGCLGGGGLEPDQLREAIREIREMTDKPFAVDLLLPANLTKSPPTREEIRHEISEEFPEHWAFVQALHQRFGLQPALMEKPSLLSNEHVKRQVEVVLEEAVPIFVAALGDPSWMIPDARSKGMKVIGIAGSVRNATRQKASGVDMVIAQGYEAGGHTGTIANFALIPQTIDAVKPLPVIAAGAIGDGRGVAAALALGAQGVWLGTAFLFSHEADIAEAHREQLDGARSEDLVISRSFTGKTARQYRNEALQAWAESGLDPLPMPYQWVLMDDFVASAEATGKIDLVNMPAGQIAGMLRGRRPARQIVDELVESAVLEISRVSSCVSVLVQ